MSRTQQQSTRITMTNMQLPRPIINSSVLAPSLDSWPPHVAVPIALLTMVSRYLVVVVSQSNTVLSTSQDVVLVATLHTVFSLIQNNPHDRVSS
jgi:hypothetical protein